MPGGFRATVDYVTRTNRKAKVGSGRALTAAEAEAEVNATLALMVVKSFDATGSVNDSFQVSAIANTSDTAQYEDAVLILYRDDADLGRVTKTRKINDMNLSLMVPGTNLVQVGHPALIAFAAAYRDDNGIGGYTLSPDSYFEE